jgi:hypothetical protein
MILRDSTIVHRACKLHALPNRKVRELGDFYNTLELHALPKS